MVDELKGSTEIKTCFETNLKIWSKYLLCMICYAEDHVEFIQSFLAYLVCITTWLDKASKIVDIFTELLASFAGNY